MEGSNAKASSAAADKYHGVTPEEVKKTRSKNPLKWFQRGGSKCASSSSASTPKQGAGVAENDIKSRQPAAPIQRSSAPLVVNYFPSGMPLSRRWINIFRPQFASETLTFLNWNCQNYCLNWELQHPPGGGANAILARALVHRILPFPLIGNRQSPDSADSCKSLRDEP
jgi:hypothetical protein